MLHYLQVVRCFISRAAFSEQPPARYLNAEIFVFKLPQRVRADDDGVEVAHTGQHIDDRLSGQTRDRCTAEVFDINEQVAHDDTQLRGFEQKRFRPCWIVVDYLDSFAQLEWIPQWHSSN